MSMAQAMEMISCSPCVRGWPFERDMIIDRMQMFPVCAGTAPLVRQLGLGSLGVPRVCGDGPM